MIETKCPNCGLIDGHGNKCYADVLIPRLTALEYIAERAKILLEAPTDHARLVADMKLKDAVHQLEIVERRIGRTA